MPPVRKKYPARHWPVRLRLWPVRLRLFGAFSAALMLQGCGGYFSGQWPNLAEGFEDAAERDAALAAAGQLPGDEGTEDPAVEKDDTGDKPIPVSVQPPAAAIPDIPAAAPLSPERLEALTTEYDQALSEIDAARQAYAVAKAEFMDGHDDRNRSRWLTAQLKLTGLSRAGDGLNSIMDELRSAAAPATGDGDQSRVTEMALSAADAAVALAAYLTRERVFLTDQDPGS